MPTASHPFSQEEMMAYLDGELSPERALVAARHLERCADCQYLTAGFRNLSQKLAEWEVDSPQSDLPRIEVSNPGKQKPGCLQWPAFASGVSLVAIMAILLLVFATPKMRHVTLTVPKPTSERSEPMAFDHRAQIPTAAGTVAVSDEPLVVRTAQIRLTSKNFAQNRNDVERIVKSHQGYVAQLELNAPAGTGRSLTVSLRIPAAQLDSVLQELKGLGHVDGESQSGEDVTRRYLDGNARLSNLRATEERLLKILRVRTGKLEDVLQVEESISQTREQIEVAEAEQKTLASQIALATVQLNIAEEYHAAMGEDSGSVLARLRNAAVAGYRNLIDGIVGVLAFLLAAGPVLLLLTAAVFPARWLWRKWRQRRLASRVGFPLD